MAHAGAHQRAAGVAPGEVGWGGGHGSARAASTAAPPPRPPAARGDRAPYFPAALAQTCRAAAPGATLAVVGSIIYPVSRIHLGEIMPKITAIGAMGRLIGMGMLTYAVCKTLKK